MEARLACANEVQRHYGSTAEPTASHRRHPSAASRS